MPGPTKRTLHPLLFERSYWRNRLQELKLARQSVLLIPRPDLSTPFVDVDEFRLRSHDGLRLYGLRAQSRIATGTGSARVRTVGPSDLPSIDNDTISQGECEYVFQEPAGRRLEDRVMDVLRICQLASDAGHEMTRGVRLAAEQGSEPDEFLIATRLLAGDPEYVKGSLLDDSAGFGVSH
ncbi:MAG: hypothetical protein SGI72_09380 [Planctomycetota bacterium]|nr:hypothetical protein [Planctomycetota bacterium]